MMTPGNAFEFFGPGTTLAYVLDLPEGTTYAQWSLFNEYTDGNHDLDLYLFYCPDFLCTQIDSSGGGTSNERVSVSFPVTDPTIDDPYVVFVHGYNTEGGAPAQFILFDWTDPNVGPDVGNMTVSGPASATLGQTATLNVGWAGLSTGAGAKQLGAITHEDGAGVVGLTIVNIVQPGTGMNIDPATLGTKGIAAYAKPGQMQSTTEFLLAIIPTTIVDAFAKGEILQVLLIAIMFGFCLHAFGGRGTLVFDMIEKTSHVLFAIVGVIMKVAPIGAFGAI